MPDVEAAVGEGRGEAVEPGGVDHGRTDRDDALVEHAEFEQLLGEDVGPLHGPGTAQGGSRTGVDLADGVEAVLDVVLGGLEAVALLGQAVHEHRPAELLGLTERPLDRLLVVTVDRADVLQPEVGEHALRRDHVLEPDLEPVQEVVGGLPHHGVRETPRRTSSRSCSYRGLVRRPARCRASPDGRGVGAAVVVDQDDQRQVLVGGDVVERLPGHATGEGAVPDERDDGAALPCWWRPRASPAA